jgi:hypothetical protein
MHENALDRLFELEPEADPPPCSCRPRWLTPAASPEPDLCEAWRCCRCGGLVIRLFGRIVRNRRTQ